MKSEEIKMARKNNLVNLATATVVDANVVLGQAVINNAYSICGKRIASVPLQLMELDHTYQRVLGKTVKKLMTEWDNDKCDLLTVSYRDNKFYIIDGQHRYSVAKAKDIADLPCIIFTGLTQQDEALKFAQQQDNVNKLSPYDTFKANVACGDESIREIAIDMKIKRVCDKYGIQVKKYGNNMGDQKVLRCLARARIAQEYFELVMDAINSSNWANCPEAYSECIYRAIYTYFYDNKGKSDNSEKKIIEMMNNITPDDLETMARFSYPEYKIGSALTLCIRDLTQDK